jgi:hypothetical protein
LRLRKSNRDQRQSGRNHYPRYDHLPNQTHDEATSVDGLGEARQPPISIVARRLGTPPIRVYPPTPIA